MNILGINAYHGDSAACLMIDGQLIAAAEEERFNRVKHWAGFPVRAIEYCLAAGGIALDEVDHVAVNRNPRASIVHKVLYVLRKGPQAALIRDRVRNALAWWDIQGTLRAAFSTQQLRAKMHHVEHHLAHLASSFLVGPFEEAALLSVDGFGDFTSTMLGVGRGAMVRCLDRVRFPVSLGIFYQAVTQHLGFPHYGDEYKVMGLAPYGEPSFIDKMRTIAPSDGNGRYYLNLDYFRHTREQLGYTWKNEAPRVGALFSENVRRLLGPPREPGDPIEQHHKDIARSVQVRYEEIFLTLVRELKERTRLNAICLSGGCAANSVANGKVLSTTDFRDVYIPAAAGDAGGAVGAASCAWASVTGERPSPLRHAYLGPEYGRDYVTVLLSRMEAQCREADVERLDFADSDQLCNATAEWIARGLVVGWFQGRMEWGPRALGNRSILCDPCRADMKEILNRKIKRRESFRPFAPSILREAVGDYFETDYDVPFMSQVFTVLPAKRALIPAVVHVDGTGRLQTVSRMDQPLYWSLIDAFRRRTGIPLVLNTSFNENEPIVNRPEEALECFLRTSMDVLVLLDTVLIRRSASQSTD